MYGLFDRLRQRGGQHVVFSLKLPAETGDEGNEKNGRGKGAVGKRRAFVPLKQSERTGKEEHGKTADRSDRAEHGKRSPEHAFFVFARSDEFRDRRGHPGGREGEQNAVYRENHLIDTDPLRTEQIGQRDAVKRADRLGEKISRREDGAAFQKAVFPPVRRGVRAVSAGRAFFLRFLPRKFPDRSFHLNDVGGQHFRREFRKADVCRGDAAVFPFVRHDQKSARVAFVQNGQKYFVREAEIVPFYDLDGGCAVRGVAKEHVFRRKDLFEGGRDRLAGGIFRPGTEREKDGVVIRYENGVVGFRRQTFAHRLREPVRI